LPLAATHEVSADLWHEMAVPDVAQACKMLAEKLRRLVKLDAELQMERKDTPTHIEVQDKLALIRRMVAFLEHGGAVPDFFVVKTMTLCSSSFVSHVPMLVGGFLITKSTGGGLGEERKPCRAVYAIEGVIKGQVALRKLDHAGHVDPDVKKLAVANPDAPSGWTADAKSIQKYLHVVSPHTLSAWCSHVMTHEVALCEEAIQKAVVEEHTRNEREAEAALRMELYNARAPWRNAMKRMRGQLLRELWATLWTANFPRVQSIAMALRRVNVSMTDKVFHEVTVSGYGDDRYYVVLEDAGATEEELPYQWQEVMQSEKLTFVRRHAQLTAIDAYDCMRGDNAAPAGVMRMRAWLLEECGAPTRKEWSSSFMTRSPGRNMMASKSFVQRILVDLINEGVAVTLPQVPETVDDLPAWRDEQDAFELEAMQASPASIGSRGSVRPSMAPIRRSVIDPRGVVPRSAGQTRVSLAHFF